MGAAYSFELENELHFAPVFLHASNAGEAEADNCSKNDVDTAGDCNPIDNIFLTARRLNKQVA